MLVLSRQRNEEIIVDLDALIAFASDVAGPSVNMRESLTTWLGGETTMTFTVVDIRGDKVRLGIHASHNIPVHRSEVYDAIQREKSMRQNRGKPGE